MMLNRYGRVKEKEIPAYLKKGWGGGRVGRGEWQGVDWEKR